MNEIEKFAYFYSDSEEFVEENIEMYREMEKIKKKVYELIKDKMKDYDITIANYERGITFRNKKTKDIISMYMEF